MINIRINNLNRLINKFNPRTIDRELNVSLLKAGYLVEAKSKKQTPVLTGRLRSSIRTRPGHRKVTISPHTNYAYFVHEGKGSNKRKGRRPFMEQGLESATPEIERLLKGVAIRIERRFNR